MVTESVKPVDIVAICGSLRSHSSNLALLQAAVRVAPAGVRIILYDGLGRLPHFNPDLDQEGGAPPPAVAELRRSLIAADAMLISSPEYAHGVPGALKNMLDWLVAAGELVDKPVALLNAAPVGGSYAQAATLAAALLLPAGTAVAQVSWSKPDSRTKATVIGAVAGGLVAGKKGAIAGAVLGNGVQAYRHSHHRVAHRHRRHHRR